MKLYREFRTQEEIDDQYDIESAMDMQPYLEWHTAGSERACKELPCQLDVQYGPTLDEVVDVFPAKQPNSPVLVFIHGGWRRRPCPGWPLSEYLRYRQRADTGDGRARPGLRHRRIPERNSTSQTAGCPGGH